MAGKGIQIIVGAEYSGKDLEKVVRDVNKLQREAAKSGKAMQQFGNKMSGVGKSLVLGVTLPLAAIGAAAVASSVQFESAMAKIVGLVGIATDEVAGMRDGVLQMAGDTARAPQELADALFVLTSAGLRGDEAMSALEMSGMAASAGLGETKDIARALAGAMNAYGSEMLSAAEATDVIVATARAGNFETSQFAASIGRALPFAQQAQGSFADLGGAVALLTRTNGDAAQSITQVSALFRAFVVPTAEATSALSAVGLTAEDVRNSIGEQGLVATLQMLDQQLGGNREKLGRLLGSSEAAAAAFQILDADATALESTFGEVNNAAGITEEAFGVVAETTGFKLQQAMANFKTVLIEIGDLLAPFVSSVAEFASGLAENMRALPDGAKQFIVALGLVAAAIGPLLLIAGKLIVLVGSVKVALVGAGGLAGIAAVAAPIAIVVAAVAGLIAIFVGLWRESEVFRNAVTSAFEAVRDAVSSAVATIQEKLQSNGEAIDTLKAVFKALGDFIGAYIIPIYKTYLVAAIEVVSTVIGVLIDYLGFMVQAFKVALSFGLQFAANIVKAFGMMADGALGYLDALIDGLLVTMGWIPGVGDALRSASDAVKGFRADVENSVDGIVSGFRSASASVDQFGASAGEAYGFYTYSARGAKTATDDYRDAAVRASMAVDTTRTGLGLLADVTSAATTATLTLNDAYADLSAFFSETLAIDRAHTQLQELRTQLDSNTAGFDGMSDAAKANRSTFIDWANSQIAAAQTLTDPIARLDALKAVQQEARDALREQGVDPKTSGFYQEVKGNVDAAKEAVGELGDATATAEAGGMSVAAAIAAGITAGMSQQESAMNAAGLAGGAATIDGLEAGAGVASPSTFAIAAGRNVAAGLTAGLSEMDFSIRLGGDIAGRTLIQGMINGLNSGSGGLYARVRAIVAAAVAAATSAASGGSGTSDDTEDVARGGLIRGRGGPMADLIPAMLSNGEFVIRAQAVEAFGPGFFDALNRGRNPLDGMEAPGPSRPSSNAGGSLVINGGITVQSASGERADQSLPRALRRMAFLAGA
jgi:TP901 family phage tail tape measure protein